MDRVVSKDLCLEKVVDLAQWLAELEDKILELNLEVEKLRVAIRDLGRMLDLE
jgi:hypothetical protein